MRQHDKHEIELSLRLPHNNDCDALHTHDIDFDRVAVRERRSVEAELDIRL